MLLCVRMSDCQPPCSRAPPPPPRAAAAAALPSSCTRRFHCRAVMGVLVRADAARSCCARVSACVIQSQVAKALAFIHVVTRWHRERPAPATACPRAASTTPLHAARIVLPAAHLDRARPRPVYFAASSTPAQTAVETWSGRVQSRARTHIASRKSDIVAEPHAQRRFNCVRLRRLASRHGALGVVAHRQLG